MKKRERHLAIKEIIRSTPIASQDNLRKELRRRGLSVTQATLSRDFAELGVGRVAFGAEVRYVLQPEAGVQRLRPLISAEVLSVTANENAIVVRTLPGCAHVIGEYVDLQRDRDIIGTIAGDNTLLNIPAAVKKTKHIVERLTRSLLKEKE